MIRRSHVRGSLTVLGGKIERVLTEEGTTEEECRILIRQLKDRMDQLEPLDTAELESLEANQASEEVVLKELENQSDYRDRAIAWSVKLEMRLQLEESTVPPREEGEDAEEPEDFQSASEVGARCSEDPKGDTENERRTPLTRGYEKGARSAQVGNGARSAQVEKEAENSQQDVGSGRRYTTGFRVPEFKLSPFDGTNILKYPSWRDSFDALIDQNTDLTKIQKFGLLKEALRGSARTLVEGLLTTNENYSIALKLLDGTYGDKNLLLGLFVAQLHGLRNVQDAGSPYLEELVLKFEQSCREIQNLIAKMIGYKVEEESEDASYAIISYFLTPHLLSKIPSDIAMKWYDRFSEPALRYNFRALVEFLKEQIKGRQACRLLNSSVRTQRHPAGGRGPQNNERMKTATFHTQAQAEKRPLKCLVCDHPGHPLYRCNTFLGKPTRERMDLVERKGLCHKCLRPGHPTKSCSSTIRCKDCHGPHTMWVCPRGVPGTSKSQVNMNHSGDRFGDSRHVLLQTLQVKVVKPEDGEEDFRTVHCLFDSAANHSWIKKELAEALGLPTLKKSYFSVQSFGGGTRYMPTEMVHCKLVSVRHDRWSFDFTPYTSDKLTEPIDQRYSAVPRHHLMRLFERREVPTRSQWVKPQIIVGADYYQDFHTGNVIRGDPTAVETYFGWTLMGPTWVPQDERRFSPPSAVFFVHNAEKLWDLEILGIEDSPNQVETVEDPIMVEGQYEVKLPFKTDKRPSSNLVQAEKRHQKLLEKTPCEKLERYDEEIGKLVTAGTIEKTAKMPQEGYFLPMHAVTKNGKVRLVFDASCKSENGRSLNETLDPGINLLNQLLDVLLQFRCYEFVYVGDISKAFHALRLAPESRKWTKFLWKDQIYQFRKVPFGCSSSPFLLNNTLQFHFGKLEDEELATQLKKSFYVDDTTHSSSSKEERDQFRNDATEVLASMGMELKEGVKEGAVLGTPWNDEADEMWIDLSVLHRPSKYTKRELLKTFSKIYDVLGMVSPFVTRFKVLFQQTWVNKISWDEELPEEMRRVWDKLLDETEGQQVAFPRWVGLKRNELWTLHVFCDASKRSYATCAYAARDTGQPRLLMAKARLSPIKETLSVPRAELMGVLLGVRIASRLTDVLPKPQATIIWSDSTATLHWILEDGPKSELFVRNRLREIHETSVSKNLQFRYVPTEMNPADIPTRGCSLSELKRSSLWWNGPQFLQSEEEWPRTLLKSTTVTHCQAKEQKFPQEADALFPLTQYSSLEKTIGVTRKVFEAIKRMQKRLIDLGEIRTKAWFYWINREQRLWFPEEVEMAKQGKPVHKHSSIHRLQPEWDPKNRTLVVVSRATGEKTPILPRQSLISEMTIREKHHQLFHQGSRATLAEVRRDLWVVKGLSAVKQIIRSCVRCRRFDARPYGSPESQLQPYQIVPTFPFGTTNLDFFGPLETKQGKLYVLLFACSQTRGVHMEACLTMTAEEAHRRIRHFLSIRVPLRSEVHFRSDNARTFLKLATMRFPHHFVDWKFVPERSPSWNGPVERLVGVIKRVLVKTFRGQRFGSEELEILLSEAAAVVNRRPLIELSSEPQDVVITPAHFLHGLPPPTKGDRGQEVTLANRLLARRKFSERFWSIWTKQYLRSLASWKRPKTEQTSPPKVGELVFVRDKPQQNQYPLAKVVELIPGRDGVIRAVFLELRGKRTRRRVSDLIPLEGAKAKPAPTEQDKEKLPALANRENEKGKVTPQPSLEPPPKPGGEQEGTRTRSGRITRIPPRYRVED